MKTIILKTEKVVSYRGDGMPVIETIEQALSPELTFNKIVKYLPSQKYKSATVIAVYEYGKKVDQVEQYQAKVDEVLKPAVKSGESVDYKALSEKQSSQMDELMQRLEALESKKENKITDADKINKLNRNELENKANELEIPFRSNIGDDKLLAKIQEVEPDFNIN